MITEKGRVIELKNGKALIKTSKSSACESCATKQLCMSSGEEDMVIEADNPVCAGKGDDVLFSVGSSTVMKTGVILYLLPILGFITGVVIGQKYLATILPEYNPDLVSAACGILLLILTFCGIRAYGRRSDRQGKFRPKIVKVL